MTWQIGHRKDDGWEFEPELYEDPQLAIACLVMKTGEIMLGREEPDGTWSVRTIDDEVVACVRENLGTQKTGEGNLGPLRRFLGLTWVGWLNMLVLQWFCVRLVYHVEDNNTISGWSYCFMLPLSRKAPGKLRRLTRQYRKG